MEEKNEKVHLTLTSGIDEETDQMLSEAKKRAITQKIIDPENPSENDNPKFSCAILADQLENMCPLDPSIKNRFDLLRYYLSQIK